MIALQWRNASWISDQSVCMSILLHRDVEAIEAIPIGRSDCHSACVCDMLKECHI